MPAKKDAPAASAAPAAAPAEPPPPPDLGPNIDPHLPLVSDTLSLFDPDNTGFVPTADVPAILHSLGVFITDAEFTAVELPQLGSAGEPAPRCARERVEARALALLAARAHAPPGALELLAAFRVFDKAGAGSVGVDKLRRALTSPTTPGALTVEEFERMLEHLPPADGDGEGQPPRMYAGYARGAQGAGGGAR
jgi:hypothetical protein